MNDCEVAEQVWVMNTQALLVLGEWQIMMSEFMLWFKRTDGLLTLIWPASWNLTVHLHTALSAMT